MIAMWECRIESIKITPIGVQPINEHFYLLQKANSARQSHSISNQFDQNLILKSEVELSQLSTNQLKLWLANFKILNNLNKLENVMGPSEPPPNPDTIIWENNKKKWRGMELKGTFRIAPAVRGELHNLYMTCTYEEWRG